MSQREYRELFRTGAKRVQALAAAAAASAEAAGSSSSSSSRGLTAREGDAFDAQNIANIVNAFASAKVRQRSRALPSFCPFVALPSFCPFVLVKRVN
jgi:hypothetical protein